jgi:hypothetical protein
MQHLADCFPALSVPAPPQPDSVSAPITIPIIIKRVIHFFILKLPCVNLDT